MPVLVVNLDEIISYFVRVPSITMSTEEIGFSSWPKALQVQQIGLP